MNNHPYIDNVHETLPLRPLLDKKGGIVSIAGTCRCGFRVWETVVGVDAEVAKANAVGAVRGHIERSI